MRIALTYEVMNRWIVLFFMASTLTIARFTPWLPTLGSISTSQKGSPSNSPRDFIKVRWRCGFQKKFVSNEGSKEENSLHNEPFVFATLGDWGNFPRFKNSCLAEVIRYGYQPQAIFLLGDNFYGNNGGIRSVSDPNMKNFEKSFPKDLYPFAQTFYPVLGNHDYHKSPISLVNITKLDDRWYFPSPYYSRLFISSGVKVFVVAIDANRLHKKRKPAYVFPKTDIAIYNQTLIPYGNNSLTHWNSLPSLKDQSVNVSKILTNASDHDETQFLWIEKQLASKVAQESDWLIVIGHHTIYSASRRGDLKLLIKRLTPMFEKYNVDMYLFGHDHVLQYLQIGKVHYFGSGAASQREKTIYKNHKGLKAYANKVYGGMVHFVRKDSMIVKFITTSGRSSDLSNSGKQNFSVNVTRRAKQLN